jgi:hypothetical protein
MSHSAEIMFSIMQKADISISIHIRRGDYVQNKKTGKHHGNCSSEYYKNALDEILSKLSKGQRENVRLFIFSDDIEWARKNLSFACPSVFVSNPATPDYEELVLMSKCSHHIIANSSFSWWGAWLDSNPQKIVIAPAKWFNTRQSLYKDIVPSSWIKI